MLIYTLCRILPSDGYRSLEQQRFIAAADPYAGRADAHSLPQAGCMPNLLPDKGVVYTMSQWFIQQDEQTEIGPLRPSELLDLVRQGVVTRETLCRKANSPWCHAQDVGGLFRAADSQVVGYRCPYCQKSVSQPPTYCKGCSKYVDQATEILRDSSGRKPATGTSEFDPPQESTSSWSDWVTRLKSSRIKPKDS